MLDGKFSPAGRFSAVMLVLGAAASSGLADPHSPLGTIRLASARSVWVLGVM